MACINTHNTRYDAQFDEQVSADEEHSPTVTVRFGSYDEGFRAEARFHASPANCDPFYVVDFGDILDPTGAHVTVFMTPEQRAQLVNALTDARVVTPSYLQHSS